jgi:16S rRNA (cytosine967-C5)-methyltransferase
MAAQAGKGAKRPRSARSLAPAHPPKIAQSARFAAIETLCQLERTRLPADVLFDAVAGQCALIENDRHLAMNILYGVLRQRQALQSLLQTLCKQPLARIKPFVHQALLTGLYQIFFLDRIPESAAVNESVKAVQAAHLPANLQGFVNAVLRESIRRKELLMPMTFHDRDGAPFLNHPDWLVRRWTERFGQEEARRICLGNNQQSPLTLNINTCLSTQASVKAALEQEGIEVQSGNYSPEALILPDFHGAIHRLPGFAAGHFQVQDEAAQLLPRLLTPVRQGGLYLDACAGLGGKTGNLIQLGQGSDMTIMAVEPDAQRRQKFRENMRRLHPDTPITLVETDLQHFAADCPHRFDGILVDAPCSGTGVAGRHPDIRWNRQERDLPRYQQIQLMLLHQAAGLVAESGILVYATCSLEAEENEKVIHHFLADHPDFWLEDCTPFLPPLARELVRDGFFAPRPGPSIDGFFGARMRKGAEEP